MTFQWINAETAHHAVKIRVSSPPSVRGPGVVLCMDDAGLGGDTGDFFSLADTLAEEGYVVSVPDTLDDIAATIAALQALPAFVGQVAIMGFGSGGRAALLAAARGLVGCAISVEPVGADPSLDELRNITVPVVHVGQSDDRAPATSAEQLRTALAASPGSEVHVYRGAERGFSRPGPGRSTSDAAARGMAYTRTIAVLRRVLGPHYDLSALWETHRRCEFDLRDAEATMKTMVAQPYVNHVPTMIGGYGQTDLHRFYRDHFIPNNPRDMKNIPISRTVGADRVVNEGILCFTHDCEIEWMLPGVPPTGRYVEVALVGIITFRGDKLVHEHIYWDQATVLVQIGLLDPRGLPVRGIDAARKVLDPTLPGNALLANWKPGD